MIHVIATITAQPGTREQLVAAFQEVVPLVHAEAGCIEYGVAIDASTSIERQSDKGSDVLTVIEKWEDEAALKAHLVAPHMATFREKAGPFIAGMELHILEPVGPHSPGK